MATGTLSHHRHRSIRHHLIAGGTAVAVAVASAIVCPIRASADPVRDPGAALTGVLRPDDPRLGPLARPRPDNRTDQRDTAPPDRPQRKNTSTTGRFIVELAEASVTTYTGGVGGIPATRPQPGQELEPDSTAARAYRQHLDTERRAVQSTVGIGADEAQVMQTYTTAFNGFAGKLSAAQVAALKADRRVRSVTESKVLTVDDAAAGFGRLTRPAGTTPNAAPAAAPAVAAATGPAWAPARTGAGTVIGVIDTGIWPESASFARRQPAPRRWRGTCQSGEQFTPSACNGKIVGARYFATAFLEQMGKLPDGEVLSPRDTDGHGTHVASTAAGLPIKHAVIDGQDFGAISGSAPDAQIAVYKALWGGEGADQDIVAAINQAVEDGVDVINLSAGNLLGDAQSVTPIGTAMLNASLAGVFVAAAAGNSGTSGTIGNDGPWVTTVGSATTRADEGTVRLGDGTRLVGGSVDKLPGRLQGIVFAEQAGSLDDLAQYCHTGSLDRRKVKDKVVVCVGDDLHGSVAEVKAKGGAGVVFIMPAGHSMLINYYHFPAVFLNTAEQAGTLYTYLTRHPKNSTVRLSSGGDGSSVPGVPSVAGYSSYGPNQYAPGVGKPDLVAPGTDIVAAVAPPGNHGRSFDVYSGTSMASPYVAGVAAVLHQAHPDWSPLAIASAMRTTATDTQGTADPLRQGSGLIQPDRAADPGLVVEPTPEELTTLNTRPTLLQGDSWPVDVPDGSEVNLPSISMRDYDASGPVVMTRRLTNVGRTRETYRAVVSGLPGMSVTVSPEFITVDPGRTATVTITLRRGTAPWDHYVNGAITWHSVAHAVRLPVAARPWGMTFRTTDDGEFEPGRQTSATVNSAGTLVPGFTGPLAYRFTGFTPTRYERSSIRLTANASIFDPAGDNVRAHRIVVPPGLGGLTVAVNAVSTGDPVKDRNTDLDLYLYKDGKRIYSSNMFRRSSEQAYVFLPEPGVYTAYVHGFLSDDRTVNYRFGTALIPRHANLNNATVRFTRYWNFDHPDTPPAKATRTNRGEPLLYWMESDLKVPSGDMYWGYLEYTTTGGQTVPGQLVYWYGL